jgi:Domain of unknown function (DUF4276)
MHLEVLVEDQSGKNFLDIALQRMVAGDHTFRVHPYKGIGRIPKNLNKNSDAGTRILLDRLPALLRGYGSAFSQYPRDYQAAVIIVCDLDDKDLAAFCSDLLAILDACSPKPNAAFCLAIEEGEAWLLGDITAIKKAYPHARERILRGYINDSICGTWECLPDAVFSGGAETLSQGGWQAIGAEKSKWALNITPHMDLESNESPSFRRFRDRVRALIGAIEKTV